LAPGNYSVVVTDASGCSGTSTVTVTSTSGLVATATATPTNCTANVGTATANPAGGTAPYTFLWSPSAQNVQTATGLGAGTYTATITDANGCITTTTATVIAPNGITAVNTTATQTSCNGGTNGTATATPTGGIAPYTYLWNNGQTTQTATGFSAGTFSVTVKDANGCSFPATVTVTQPVAVVFVPSTVADTCGKKQGTASATVSGGLAPYTYMWLTNPVQSAVTAVGLMGGNYSCIITDANGCTAMGSASVANIPGPTANFIPFPQVVDILDANVYFLDLSSNANTWLWDFGDGPSSSTQQHPTHLYQNEGTFLVTLIVTSAQGCLDTISETVVVEGYTSFYVPNTFTPNGDGRNDFFTPVFSRIDSSAFSMQIFDRWGNEIFKTTTPGDYWDGRAYRRGPVVQEDVYAYVITYRDIKKQDHKLVGNVNVVK
jgi:gliding motility-associated-like protein